MTTQDKARAMELNQNQKKAVFHEKGPLFIIAGAGSGKTKTLTSRLRHLIDGGINPKQIIAITFTNKAAKEMRERATGKSTLVTPNSAPFIGTFHSLGARILKEEASHLGRTNRYTIYDKDDSLRTIKAVLKSLGIDRETIQPMIALKEISRVKSELLSASESLDARLNIIFEAYETALEKNNAFDFDDLLEKVVYLFKTQPEILEKYEQRFTHVLVDEFQDVNPAQYQFVYLLSSRNRNLSVVGDDAQSIYGFRGSDFRNFVFFERDWPDATLVVLDQNYRSTETILLGASSVIKNNVVQRPKELRASDTGGDPITVIKTTSADEEADFIAGTIRTVISKPTTQETIAVLYRTNAQSRAIEQALIARNIPYIIFGGLKFYERKEIKDIVAALRLVLNPKDAVSETRIMSAFPKATARHLIEILKKTSFETPIISILSRILGESDYYGRLRSKFPNAEERIENIEELISFAKSFETLSDFIERISLLQSDDAPKKRTGRKTHNESHVSLMTIHLSKGLEFDTVFVAGCTEGLLPHERSYRTNEEIEEERRLMYVAMTRAKKRLMLTFSHVPSRFLYEISPEATLFLDLAGENITLPDEDEKYIEYD